MLFSLNANASTSMLARMCSNWLKFRFHCKNGSTFSFYFNPRESPFLSSANFVILPHQGHIKSVLVCGTLFEKKGCWELVRSLPLKQFLYTTGGLLVITYLLAWVHSKWIIGSFFYNLHLTLSAHSPRARGTEMAKKFQENWSLLKPSPLKFCPSRGRFEWSHDYSVTIFFTGP